MTSEMLTTTIAAHGAECNVPRDGRMISAAVRGALGLRSDQGAQRGQCYLKKWEFLKICSTDSTYPYRLKLERRNSDLRSFKRLDREFEFKKVRVKLANFFMLWVRANPRPLFPTAMGVLVWRSGLGFALTQSIKKLGFCPLKNKRSKIRT